MRYFFSGYGLRLEANREIPGLAESTSAKQADVQITFGRFPDRFANFRPDGETHCFVSDQTIEGRPVVRVTRTPGQADFHFRYQDETEFLVDRQGRSIWARWAAHSTLADTTTYLVNPIMAFVLGLRGVPCLHASAITVRGGAIALIGPSGSGKSTTAAAFAALGYSPVTDDVAALSQIGGTILVQPAYPRLRLWPDAAKDLFGVEAELPSLTPNWDKRYLDLSSDEYLFPEHPLPLVALYLLAPRNSHVDTASFRPVNGRKALVSLLSNVYGYPLLDKSQQARQFQLIGALCADLPIRQVTMPEDFAALPDACTAIVTDARTAFKFGSAIVHS